MAAFNNTKEEDASACAVLGMPKTYDGTTQEDKDKPFMHYFKMPRDNDNTISNLLLELMLLKINRKESNVNNSVNGSKMFNVSNN